MEDIIGQSWTREYFNDYTEWLERALISLLKKDSEKLDEISIISALKDANIIQDPMFVKYLLQCSGGSRHPESAFLLDAMYIGDIELMNELFYEIKRNKAEFSIKDEIYATKLKIFLSEFLYLCGFDDADIHRKKYEDKLKTIQTKCDTINSNLEYPMMQSVDIRYIDGTQGYATILHKDVKGKQGWYTKIGKSLKKIRIDGADNYICGKGNTQFIIIDKSAISMLNEYFHK